MIRPVYSLNHYICPSDVGLLDFLDLAAGNGFVGVGLTERALGELPVRQLADELRARHLAVSSLNSAGRFLHADKELLERQEKQNAWLIECAAALGPAPLNVYTGGLEQGAGTMSLSEARALSATRLAALHRRMDEAGVAMVFEPIHPMFAWIRSVINDLQQTSAVIGPLPGSTVNLDLFHSWWDPRLQAFIEEPDSRLGVLQICDVDHSQADGISRRVPLGEGSLDVPGIVRTVLARPRPPLIEVELFAFQLEGRDFKSLVESTVRYLQGMDEGCDAQTLRSRIASSR